VLFDTTSPGRKRVIRVVYSVLALLFLVGFVGFGVGGNFSGGGILDALGITDSGGSGSGDDAFKQQIDDLNARIEKNPNDANALTTLVNLEFRAAVANYQDNQDIDDARPDLESAVGAWEKYLKTNPKEPSATAAPFAAQAYQALGDLKGAAKAQQVVVDAHPQVQQYFQLASYYYADSNFKAGEQTAKEAVAAQKSSKSKAKVRKQFDKLEQTAKKQAKLIKAQQQAQGGSQGGQQLEDPFGSLGGSSTGGTTVTP
jgi:tetratricopeptide (TPR) repeat protein